MLSLHYFIQFHTKGDNNTKTEGFTKMEREWEDFKWKDNKNEFSRRIKMKIGIVFQFLEIVCEKRRQKKWIKFLGTKKDARRIEHTIECPWQSSSNNSFSQGIKRKDD